MARIGFNFTLVGTTKESTGLGVTYATLRQSGNDGGTALIAAIGVLVADGATPTQAHVTTANAALPPIQGDLTVSFDNTKITTVNQLKRACDALLQAARGSGIPEA